MVMGTTSNITTWMSTHSIYKYTENQFIESTSDVQVPVVNSSAQQYASSVNNRLCDIRDNNR